MLSDLKPLHGQKEKILQLLKRGTANHCVSFFSPLLLSSACLHINTRFYQTETSYREIKQTHNAAQSRTGHACAKKHMYHTFPRTQNHTNKSYQFLNKLLFSLKCMQTHQPRVAQQRVTYWSVKRLCRYPPCLITSQPCSSTTFGACSGSSLVSGAAYQPVE